MENITDFAYCVRIIPKHKVFCFVGTKGSGKTTKLLQFVKNRLYFDKQGRLLPHKSIWYTYSTDELYDNFMPICYKHIGKFTKGDPKLDTILRDPARKIETRPDAVNFYFERLQDFKNGTLVIDDAASMFNYTLKENFQHILTNTRHSNIDVVLVFHSIDQIPKFIFTSINYILLFKTSIEPNISRTKMLNNYKHLLNAHARAQNSPNKYYWEFIEII